MLFISIHQTTIIKERRNYFTVYICCFELITFNYSRRWNMTEIFPIRRKLYPINKLILIEIWRRKSTFWKFSICFNYFLSSYASENKNFNYQYFIIKSLRATTLNLSEDLTNSHFDLSLKIFIKFNEKINWNVLSICLDQ